jgi:hypothetical protein
MLKAPKRNELGFTGIMLLAVFLLWLSPAYGSGTITEDFTNNQYDTKLWDLFEDLGQGTTAQVINDRLEVTVAGGGYAVFSGWGFSLLGDFDVRVDFTLIDWPANNGTQLTIGPFNLPFWVQLGRANAPPDVTNKEQYFSIFAGDYQSFGVAGPTLNGTLRLVRTGNKMEGFYYDGANWQSIGSATDASLGGRAGVSMAIGPYGNNYTGIPAKAAFDNIQINYTTLGPGFEQGNPGAGIMLLLDK